MKLLTSVIIIVLLLLVYLFVFKQSPQSRPVNKPTPINQVSLQNIETNNNVKTSIANKKQNIKSIIADDGITQKSNADIDAQDDPELSYITAYRDWQYFANCYTDVEDFHNNKDPLDTLAERFANNPRESQTEPTPQQNMYYQHHVEICKGMIDNEKDDYYQIMQKLKLRFQKIIPKTDEEKQLAHALEMTQQLKSFKNQFTRAHYRKSNLPKNELNNINVQIEELADQMMTIYEGNEILSEQQTTIIKQYSEQIDKLRIKITTSEVVDEDLINSRASQINGYLNSIDDYLHRVQSADAFLVLANDLYKAEYYQKDSNIIKSLKNNTGIYDPYYINTLNNIVMPLIACSMNYPCSADSDYILSYCLGLRDSMFNQACGLNLEDFYFSFYIGTNQLNDVNNYFNFLVNRYAK